MEMFTYQGYQGSVETSIEDDVLHGKILFINDLVTYEATTIKKLRQEFELAVPDLGVQRIHARGVNPDQNILLSECRLWHLGCLQRHAIVINQEAAEGIRQQSANPGHFIECRAGVGDLGHIQQQRQSGSLHGLKTIRHKRFGLVIFHGEQGFAFGVTPMEYPVRLQTESGVSGRSSNLIAAEGITGLRHHIESDGDIHIAAQGIEFLRGEALYEENCDACHNERIHWRAQTLVTDWPSLKAQVRRWQSNAGQRWADADVIAVAQYLNTLHYHYQEVILHK